MTAFKPGDRVHMWAHVHTPATTGTVTGTTPEGRTLVQWDDNNTITPHHPQNLEPAGEPMQTDSNTFKSGGDIVQAYALTPQEFIVNTFNGEWDTKGTQAVVDNTDAPAICLAILEAAGVKVGDSREFRPGSESHLEFLARSLTEYIDIQDRKAKEAADREALEVEALHLCRIMWNNPDQAWTPMSQEAKEKWLKMARTARELHGVTK